MAINTKENTMSQVVALDLNKNPDLKDLIADMEAGAAIDLHCSLRRKDDQTVEVRIQSASAGEEEEKDEETGDMEDSEDVDEMGGGTY